MGGPVPEVSELLAIAHVKARWSDPWIELPLLEPITVSDVAAPAHATATFNHVYGSIQMPGIGSRPEDLIWSLETPDNRLGYYVRVATTQWLWYGILIDRENLREGDLSIVPAAASGEEKYTAYGMSLLLDIMNPIRQAYVFDDTEFINWGLPFNGGLDGRERAHRAGMANKKPNELGFADRVAGAVEEWTALTALQYLLQRFPPRDINGVSQVPWGIIFQTATNPLDYKLPMFEYDGQTLWQILQRLITRGRGLGFNVIITNTPSVVRVGDGLVITPSGTETCNVNVWSYAEADFVLPSGFTIPANPNQQSFNLGGAINIRQERVTESVQQRFRQVRVIGAKRGSVCTLKPGGFPCLPGWKPAGRDAYNTARSGDADYGTLADADKAARNAKYRRTDGLSRVFSLWNVDGNWNREVTYDPGTGAVQKKVFPRIEPDGSLHPTEESYQWVAALRIADFLPMRQGVDYSGTVTPATSEVTGDENDFLPMQVWFDFVLAEHLDYDADTDVAEPRQWTVQTRIHQDWPALNFDVVNGEQHFICSDVYVQNGSYEEIESTDRALVRDSWRATVYLQAQEPVVAVYPADADVIVDDVHTVFDVEMPDAHFDILVPGTTVGVHWPNGVATYIDNTPGGILRDDRAAMEDEARLLYEWTRAERNILQLDYTGFLWSLPVGTMFTQIGGGGQQPQTINTVLTSLTMNLKTGEVSLQTQAAELDILSEDRET